MKLSMFRAIPLVVWLTAGHLAVAQDETPRSLFFVYHLHKEGTPAPGKPRWIPHTDDRAGFPRDLGKHLEPSVTAGGVGYFVGGGMKHGRGEPRRRNEGTWGWDETGGAHFRGRVILGWSHGRKYQGGIGAYRTDGPVVPDLIYATTSALNSLDIGRNGRKSD
jgi:hypothetical protein